MEINPGKMPDLDSFRPYLTVLTRGHIPVAMQSRLDASDIVQETMLEAHRKVHQFEGCLEPRQLAGWLRQLLVCNLLDAIKSQYRGQRDVRREQAIQLAIDESALGLENILAANDTSPSELEIN